MKVFWLATGAAVGYVFGTKAGRERYEQIRTAARQWADKPAVADAVGKVERIAAGGRDAVTAKLSDASDAVTSKLSSGSKPSGNSETVPASGTKPLKTTSVASATS